MTAAFACRAPTEITVVVVPHELCAPGKPELRVAFSSGPRGGAETTAPNAMATGCPAGGSYSLVYVPEASKSASIDVKILAARGKDPSSCDASKHDSDCIWQRRAVSFLPHQPLTVTIDLASACLGIPCDKDTTCNPANGECIAKDAPMQSCEGATCGAPGDAGASDATIGADSDSGSDATVDSGGVTPEAAPGDSGSDGGRDTGADGEATRDGGTLLLNGTPTPGTACPTSAPCSFGETCVIDHGQGRCVSGIVSCNGTVICLRCDGPEDCPSTSQGPGVCCYVSVTQTSFCSDAITCLNSEQGTPLCSANQISQCPNVMERCYVSSFGYGGECH
jgi:hypothetical protein